MTKKQHRSRNRLHCFTILCGFSSWTDIKGLKAYVQDKDGFKPINDVSLPLVLLKLQGFQIPLLSLTVFSCWSFSRPEYLTPRGFEPVLHSGCLKTQRSRFDKFPSRFHLLCILKTTPASELWYVTGSRKILSPDAQSIWTVKWCFCLLNTGFRLYSFGVCIIGPDSWQRGLACSHRALLTQWLPYLCRSSPAAISVCVFTFAVSSGGKGEFITVMLWQLHCFQQVRQK